MLVKLSLELNIFKQLLLTSSYGDAWLCLASLFLNVPSLNLFTIWLNVFWCCIDTASPDSAECKKEDSDFHFPATYFWQRSYQKVWERSSCLLLFFGAYEQKKKLIVSWKKRIKTINRHQQSNGLTHKRCINKQRRLKMRIKVQS